VHGVGNNYYVVDIVVECMAVGDYSQVVDIVVECMAAGDYRRMSA